MGLILTWGPGHFSLDALAERWLRARLPLLFDYEIWPNDALRHVIVVGVGFGGVAAARALKNAPCQVTVINRHNFHLFKPLLYQVATAALSPADLAAPIRDFSATSQNARVLTGRVTDVQRDENCVVLEDERTLACDHLVIATAPGKTIPARNPGSRLPLTSRTLKARLICGGASCSCLNALRTRKRRAAGRGS